MRNGNLFIERITRLLKEHVELNTSSLHSKLIQQLNGRGRPYRNNLTINQLTNMLANNFRKVNNTTVRNPKWIIKNGEEE